MEGAREQQTRALSRLFLSFSHFISFLPLGCRLWSIVKSKSSGEKANQMLEGKDSNSVCNVELEIHRPSKRCLKCTNQHSVFACLRI